MSVKVSVEPWAQPDHLYLRILDVLNLEYWWISARDFALTEISFESYLLGKLKTCETLRAEKTPSSNSSKRILLKYFQSRDTCTIILEYVWYVLLIAEIKVLIEELEKCVKEEEQIK